MKKSFYIIIISTFLFACNDDIKVNDNKLDKLDAAGKDLQKSVRQGVDTVASKLKKLKNKIDDGKKN